MKVTGSDAARLSIWTVSFLSAIEPCEVLFSGTGLTRGAERFAPLVFAALFGLWGYVAASRFYVTKKKGLAVVYLLFILYIWILQALNRMGIGVRNRPPELPVAIWMNHLLTMAVALVAVLLVIVTRQTSSSRASKTA